MTDLSSVAREAAEQLARVEYSHAKVRDRYDADLMMAGFSDGFMECASRLPSEEELAEAMFVAYADETGKPWAEERHGIRSLYLEQARAALALIAKRLLG